MKYFAYILQRPMAFIFLLLFAAGCLVLLYSIETNPQTLAEQESVQNQDLSAVPSDKDVVSPNEPSLLEEIAVGGPDQVEVYVPEIGDSGEEDSAFVVVSEVVEDPSQCTQLEKYDAVRQVCYFTCDTTLACDQQEKAVNDLLSELEGVYDQFAGSYLEMPSDDEKIKTLATYRVEENEWLENETGNDLQKYKDIWIMFSAISPDDISNSYLQKYTVYDNKKSNTAAFVERITPTDGKWELAINIAAISEQSRAENIFLLTHEFAHVLTLNESQIDTQAEESACAGYFTVEGCATDTSYLGLFFERFWSQADVLALRDGTIDAKNVLFEQEPENFLNEYAATNPGEDIAESFAAFIFKPKPTVNEQGIMTIAQQKVNFFYDFPELIKMRVDIREALNLERNFERR